MVPEAKRIVISGYYGYGNSGDEAVLHSILLALRQESVKQNLHIEPVVLSISPKATEQMHGVKAVHRLKLFQVISAIRQSDGLISGGGSLLQDTTGLRTIPYYLGIIKLAQLLGKPTFIYSQGIGPISRKSFYPLIRNAFNRSQYVSIRDAESIKLLKELGVHNEALEMVSDPVMGLPIASDIRSGVDPANVPVIGISVRFWHRYRKDLDQITKALRMIMDRRAVQLRFFPFHLPQDMEASQYVIKKLGLQYKSQMSVVTDAENPQDMLQRVGECDVLIGMRLHSLIYAASCMIPLVGISYDPKIDHFLERLGIKAIGSTDELNPERITEETLTLLQNKKQWIESKQQLIEQLKMNSQQPAQHICKYLRFK